MPIKKSYIASGKISREKPSKANSLSATRSKIVVPGKRKNASKSKSKEKSKTRKDIITAKGIKTLKKKSLSRTRNDEDDMTRSRKEMMKYTENSNVLNDPNFNASAGGLSNIQNGMLLSKNS